MDQITNRSFLPHADLRGEGLIVDGVSKTYGPNGDATEVLRNISFDVGEGEIVGIVGRSGCGKSTLLKLIAGLDRDFVGRIALNGNRVTGPGVERGVVFQEPRLFPWLTVEQNVAIAIHETKMPMLEKLELVASNLSLVGLAGFGNRFPHQISGGMAQRAALARALTSQPRILLLDEPFAALDALTKMQLQDEVIRIWEGRKMSIILITHDIDEAIHLCDRIIVMSPRPGEIKSVTNVDISRPRARIGTATATIRSSLMSDLGLS